jgi:two-component system cell cycle response regulator DivK
MRILYVEDNPANLFLVQRVARMGNHEVMNYTSGEAALENFERDHPDLVLMDVQLAGNMTGLDVVRKLRGSGYHTPIIAVTAYAMIGDRERCLDAGCDDYLAKPLPVPKLVEIIKRYDPLQQDEEANPSTLPSRPTQELPPPDKMPYINRPDNPLKAAEAFTLTPPAPAATPAPAAPVAPPAPASSPAPAPVAPTPAPTTEQPQAPAATPAAAPVPTPAADVKPTETVEKPAETKAPETAATPPVDSNVSTTASAIPAVPTPTPPAESKPVEENSDPDAKTEPFRPVGLEFKKEDKA